MKYIISIIAIIILLLFIGAVFRTGYIRKKENCYVCGAVPCDSLFVQMVNRLFNPYYDCCGCDTTHGECD